MISPDKARLAIRRMAKSAGLAERLTVLRRLHKDEDGVSAIEFGMLAPVLILLILGLFDFGMAINRTMTLDTAANLAAKYAIMDSFDVDGIEAAVESHLANNPNPRAVPMSVGGTPVDTPIVEARDYCQCAESTSEVLCTTTCADGDPAMRFVELSIVENHELLFDYRVLPREIPLSTTTVVRAR